MGNRGTEAHEQIEDEKLLVPHFILDSGPEDLQVDHVSEEVHEAGMHEHRRDDRQPDGNGCFFQTGNVVVEIGFGIEDGRWMCRDVFPGDIGSCNVASGNRIGDALDKDS